MTTSHLNQTEWENRSIQYGTSLKSVLFKRLPGIVNEHISNWHVRFILENIVEKEEYKNFKILVVVMDVCHFQLLKDFLMLRLSE